MTAPPLFRRSRRHVLARPVPLSQEDTELFLRLAGEGTYRSSVRRALRRRGYLFLGNRFFPMPSVAAAYHAFARAIAVWTLESVSPTGRRDVTAVLGRRRVGVLDVADDGTSTLDAVGVHTVPALLADRMHLGPRPLCTPHHPLTVPDPLDVARNPREWVVDVTPAVAATWAGIGADLRSGRWTMHRLVRNWLHDDADFGADAMTVLDTPSGLLRIESDAGSSGVSLHPATAEVVWDRLVDGPSVLRLEDTESSRRRYLMGTTSSPLASHRRARSVRNSRPHRP